MATIGRVLPSEIGTLSKTSRLYMPLRLKLFGVLLLSLVPMLLVSLSLTGVFSVLSHLTSTQQQVAIGGHLLPVPLVVLCAAALVSLMLGYLLIGAICIRPIDKLRKWFTHAQESNFTQIPVMPHAKADDIGDLTEAVGRLSAYVVNVNEHNKSMGAEKTMLIQIAAHQLRTPMTGLSWSIAGLLNPETTAEAKQQLMGNLDAALKRMSVVVNHLLATLKVEEGRFGYVMEEMDIVAVIDKLIAECAPIAKDKGLELRFDHPATVPKVYGDTEHLSLALMDLIDNAIDYTPSGGHITLEATPKADRVEVSVADTGIGIPEKELPLLFTKFYRGDNARHIRPDGTGLGLYLVKNIIANHQSEIVVQSDSAGGGTRFSFTLSTKKFK